MELIDFLMEHKIFAAMIVVAVILICVRSIKFLFRFALFAVLIILYISWRRFQ